MIKGKIIILLALISCMPVVGLAINLNESYNDALSFNPKYLQQQAQSAVAKDQIAITRAPLLPNISAGGTYNYNHNDNSNFQNMGFSLNLSQTIFNFAQWDQVAGVKLTSVSQMILALAAKQDLMTHIAQAYFDVASAQATLRLDNNKADDQQQLYHLALTRFRAGQTTRVSVDNAKAAMAATKTQIISDENKITKTKSVLAQFTGKYPKSVAEVKETFVLVSPTPNDLVKWLDKAKQQNLSVKADRYALQAAQQNISTARAGHLPTLSANAGYGATHAFTHNSTLTGYQNDSGLTAGLSLNFPIFSGGAIIANTQQAQDQYTIAYQQLRDTTQSYLNLTRQAYANVENSIRSIRSLKSSVSLQKQALKDTVISFKAGMLTMQDVLTAQDNLYTEENSYIQEVYLYLNSILTLKQAAGTLQASDLAKVNRWLQ